MHAHWLPRFALPSALFMSVLTLTACSSDEASESSDAMTEANYAERLATAYCAAGQFCCDQAGLQPNANCVAQMTQRIRELTQPSDSGFRFDPRMAAQCHSQLEAMLGSCAGLAPDDFANSPYAYPACGLIYHAPRTKDIGQACEQDIECLWPDDLDRVQCLDGVCAGTRIVSEGEPCQQNETGVSDLCADKLGCSDGVCRKLPSKDQPCLQACLPHKGCGQFCASGLTCNEESAICELALTGCEYDSQCPSSNYECVEYWCELTLAGKGEPCSSDYECISQSCDKNSACAPLEASISAMVSSYTCQLD